MNRSDDYRGFLGQAVWEEVRAVEGEPLNLWLPLARMTLSSQGRRGCSL